MKIAVAGTGYVGLSLAVLLAQYHEVTAVDVIPEKVESINRKESPIADDYLEQYLREKKLCLHATLDARSAYAKYEAGELNIRASVIIALRKIYQCSYDEFFVGLDE